MAGIPVVDVIPGVVEADPDTKSLRVNVNGAYPSLSWPAGYIPSEGDTVRVLIVNNLATVLGPITSQPPASRGTVQGAPSGGRVSVNTAGGVLSAEFAGTAPASGTEVFLDWQQTVPRILSGGAAASSAAPATPPPAGVAPPGGATASGRDAFVAIDSGSFSPAGGWSGSLGAKVAQGTWGRYSYQGAWFYGGAPAQFRGARITGATVLLGARLRTGQYNAPITLEMFVHSSPGKSGAPAVIARGHMVTVAPGAGPHEVDIPANWAQTIVDQGGGGLGLIGGTYGGVEGVTYAESGRITFNWVR